MASSKKPNPLLRLLFILTVFVIGAVAGAIGMQFYIVNKAKEAIANLSSPTQLQETALDLLSNKGEINTNLQAVAERAGLSTETPVDSDAAIEAYQQAMTDLPATLQGLGTEGGVEGIMNSLQNKSPEELQSLLNDLTDQLGGLDLNDLNLQVE